MLSPSDGLRGCADKWMAVECGDGEGGEVMGVNEDGALQLDAGGWLIRRGDPGEHGLFATTSGAREEFAPCSRWHTDEVRVDLDPAWITGHGRGHTDAGGGVVAADGQAR